MRSQRMAVVDQHPVSDPRGLLADRDCLAEGRERRAEVRVEFMDPGGEFQGAGEVEISGREEVSLDGQHPVGDGRGLRRLARMPQAEGLPGEAIALVEPDRAGRVRPPRADLAGSCPGEDTLAARAITSPRETVRPRTWIPGRSVRIGVTPAHDTLTHREATFIGPEWLQPFQRKPAAFSDPGPRLCCFLEIQDRPSSRPSEDSRNAQAPNPNTSTTRDPPHRGTGPTLGSLAGLCRRSRSRPGSSAGSTSRCRESATTSSTAGTACWSSTSTTATGSSSGSRPPGSTPRACRTTSRGSAPAPGPGRVYISTIQQLMCLDLVDREAALGAGSTRAAATGWRSRRTARLIYLPSLEGPLLVRRAGRGRRGRRQGHAQLGLAQHDHRPQGRGGLSRGPELAVTWSVASTSSHEIVRKVGPFAASIRPFTVNGRQTLCFVNVNDLLGFEVGDLTSGTEASSRRGRGLRERPDQAARLPEPRHRPDARREGALAHRRPQQPDAHLRRDRDAAHARSPASCSATSRAGSPSASTADYAYPSTGDVIDVKTRKIVAELKDETGRPVQSEKMMEIDFQGRRAGPDRRPVRYRASHRQRGK